MPSSPLTAGKCVAGAGGHAAGVYEVQDILAQLTCRLMRCMGKHRHRLGAGHYIDASCSSRQLGSQSSGHSGSASGGGSGASARRWARLYRNTSGTLPSPAWRVGGGGEGVWVVTGGQQRHGPALDMHAACWAMLPAACTWMHAALQIMHAPTINNTPSTRGSEPAVPAGATGAQTLTHGRP